MAADVHRCLILLRQQSGSTRSDVRAALETVNGSIDGGSSDPVTVRRLMRVEDDPLEHSFAEDPFVAAVDVRTTQGPGALLDGLAGIGHLPVSAFDLARSTAVAGVEHTIDTGSGDLGLLFCMRPKPGMTLAEFHDYWLNVHAPHHARRSGLGYRQIHANADLTQKATETLGVANFSYGGVADAVLASVPGMAREPTRGDRVNFVDEKSEVGMVFALVP